jgi:hypothetical protein
VAAAVDLEVAAEGGAGNPLNRRLVTAG